MVYLDNITTKNIFNMTCISTCSHSYGFIYQRDLGVYITQPFRDG